MKSHIGPNGPGKCSAEKGKCPFGGEENHFKTLKEAELEYELRMIDQRFYESTKKGSYRENEKIFLKYGLDPETIPFERNEVWKYADKMVNELAGFESETVDREELWEQIVGYRNREWIVGITEREYLLNKDQYEHEWNYYVAQGVADARNLFESNGGLQQGRAIVASKDPNGGQRRISIDAIPSEDGFVYKLTDFPRKFGHFVLNPASLNTVKVIEKNNKLVVATEEGKVYEVNSWSEVFEKMF